MICSECGSYQPNRAKFCGICGAPLSQEGLVESFFKHKGDEDMGMPRRRSLFFYFAVGLVVILALAVLAGSGYLIYRVVWGDKNPAEEKVVVEKDTLDYADPNLGYSFSYPDSWVLEQGYPVESELVSLGVFLTSQKKLDLRAYQLDPIVSVGGMEGIEEYLTEDANRRIQSLGGGTQPGATAGATDGSTGYAQPPPDGESVPGEEEDLETGGNDNFFHKTSINGLPVFYTEFNANLMGEDTRFLLYYIIAGDYIFFFQGQAPASEYPDVRPLFMAIAGSLQWQSPGEEAPEEGAPGVGSGTDNEYQPFSRFSAPATVG